MPISTIKKKLQKLFSQLFPKAKLTKHPLGMVLRRPGHATQLICCELGQERPFNVTFRVAEWERMFVAAARLGAELSYATPDELGISALVLPLTATDRFNPNWKNVVDTRIYDELEEEYVSAEVVQYPKGAGNAVQLPEHQWSEYQLESHCLDWLRTARPEAVAFHNPVEACVKQWRHYTTQGVLKGAADCVVSLPGRVLFVEFKVKRNTLSDEQQEFGRRVQANGQQYAVVRSVEQFKRLVEN